MGSAGPATPSALQTPQASISFQTGAHAVQAALLEALQPPLRSTEDEVVKQALYTICNMATGAEAHKAKRPFLYLKSAPRM